MAESLAAQIIAEARDQGRDFAHPFRILVTGSRAWQDQAAVYGELDDLLREHKIVRVIHGACPEGADKIAKEWVVRAFRTSLLGFAEADPHPADWNKHGRQAGFIRNAEMVALGADLCLAFLLPCTLPACRGKEPHDTHGAAHCASLARKAGIPVREVRGG